jgi:hypothetical protein
MCVQKNAAIFSFCARMNEAVRRSCIFAKYKSDEPLCYTGGTGEVSDLGESTEQSQVLHGVH